MTARATERTRATSEADPRAATWLAWLLAGLAGAMFAAGVVLFFLARSAGDPESTGTTSVIDVLIGDALFLVFCAVGALIASSRSRNPIGWLCLAVGLLFAFMSLIRHYVAYGAASPGSVPFPLTISALTGWMWVPTVGLLGIYLILLFPDGQLPSPRWRPLAWLSGAVVAVESVAIFFTPGRLVELGGMRNPFGLESQPWVGDVGWVVLPLLPLCMLAAAASLILRYRRSGGEVRQQIKWIAFAASVLGVVYGTLMIGGLVNWLLSDTEYAGELGGESLLGAIINTVLPLSFLGVPVAIGFAVMKYRLYDIELIINRTLVYASLTAILVAVYGGSVISLQYAFRQFTGQRSQLVVVASTLLIAALFSPLRRSIQSLIDRRFYRKKYDARRALEAFAVSLRDETDLDALGGEVAGVVRDTVQPAHVSLWLRSDGVSRSEEP